MTERVDVRSPYYPYPKPQENYFDLSDTVSLPRKICDYLIDAPDGNYTPPDDNRYPRCRFWKYLYYDGAKPLSRALPSIREKMSVVFRPEEAENPPTQAGYRLFPQIFVKPSQTEAQTRVYCYMGRTVPLGDEFRVALSVMFRVWTHYTQEANVKTDAYSRVFAIEQALIEALHGVNMAGVGTFFFSKLIHPDCGSTVIYDGEANIGREITIGLETATTVPSGFGAPENQIAGNAAGTLRWG